MVRNVPDAVKTQRTVICGTTRVSMETPADRLQQARREAGYHTAKKAAAAFGWNENTYKSHENGARGIRLGAAQRYARAFRVSDGWLLTGVDPQTKLSADESDLLAKFRALRSEAAKRQAINIVGALDVPEADTG